METLDDLDLAHAIGRLELEAAAHRRAYERDGAEGDLRLAEADERAAAALRNELAGSNRWCYHVPRSQVWAGSRGRQHGNVHLHLGEALEGGRLRRRAGAALCGRSGWYERPPDEREAREERCPRCVDLAGRYGVAVPSSAGALV